MPYHSLIRKMLNWGKKVSDKSPELNTISRTRNKAISGRVEERLACKWSNKPLGDTMHNLRYFFTNAWNIENTENLES